jgi:predicted phage tail protein
VTWTPPAEVSTVTRYEVIVLVLGSEGLAPPAAVTYSPTTTSAVVTNLVNGDAYAFQVTAHNAVGAGPLSGVSNSVVSATGLLAPTIGTATNDGLGGVAVSWTAPAADGGSPVSGYVVTGYVGFWGAVSAVFNSTATTQSMTNLQPGQTYRFRVRAINAFSTSARSKVTNPITAPQPMAPQAPTDATAVAGNAQATVSWTAPSHNGGPPITGYTVTAYIGYFPSETLTFFSNATTEVFTGLTNGVTYRFRVQARNDVGTGAYSKVSNPVTPTA